MSMYTQAMLAEWLKDIIITFHPGNCELTSDGGIVLLTGGRNNALFRLPLRRKPYCNPRIFFSSRLLYETKYRFISLCTKQYSDSGAICLISAGFCNFPDNFVLPNYVTLIETRLSLLPLYNRLHEHLHRFRIWDEELHHIVYTNGGLQALLEHA